MVPNIDGTMGHKIKIRKDPRHGTQCVIQYPTNRNPAQSRQKNRITAFVPRLYNSLPKYLRDIESFKTEKFEFEVDKFLELIPDESKMSNYVTASGSNIIIEQLTHLRAQGIYQSGGVPDFEAVLAASKPLQGSKCRTSQFARCFLPAQVRMWNDLPCTVFDTGTLDGFKGAVKSWLLP